MYESNGVKIKVSAGFFCLLEVSEANAFLDLPASGGCKHSLAPALSLSLWLSSLDYHVLLHIQLPPSYEDSWDYT